MEPNYEHVSISNISFSLNGQFTDQVTRTINVTNGGEARWPPGIVYDIVFSFRCPDQCILVQLEPTSGYVRGTLLTCHRSSHYRRGAIAREKDKMVTFDRRQYSHWYL